mgnify:FL=1
MGGTDPGLRPIVRVSMTQEDYDAGVGDQMGAGAGAAADATKTYTMDELMAKGEAVYNTSCAACHQAEGQGIPGVFPAIAGSAIAKGDVAAHVDIVVNGKDGTAMQAFGEQLGDTDLAAVVTYQRNAFGNDTGDLVQPTDISAAK